MKPIRIDFAPVSAGRAFRRTSIRTWVFAAVGLAGAGYGAFEAAALLVEHVTAQQEIQALEAKRTQREAQRPVPKKNTITDAQAAAVNGAIAQLNLPWRDVLDAVEAATPASIALLSVQPDAKKYVVKGMAEAKSSDAMIGYIEQLKQQAFFKAVVLTRHEINDQDPNRPLRFQYEARWGDETQ